MTKVSYLVSTYDSGQYLDAHIEDLINSQTDQNFEIIVVNPNSPGSDHYIAEKWSQLDQRVRYIYHNTRENYGSSWLRAWSYAQAPIVVNSNTDDFHHPDFTKDFYEAMMSADEKISFSYAGIVVVNENRQVINYGIKPPFSFEEYQYTCYGGPQLCWRNDKDFKSLLDWDLMYRRAAEYSSAFDYWLALYQMSLGFHGMSIPKLLTFYTLRSDSIENSNWALNNYETFASISEFFPEHFDGVLKDASEFRDFNNLPNQEDWINERNSR